MKKTVAILGSTGSIGTSTLSVISKNKNFEVILLTANNNINKLYNQAIKFKVKNVIVSNKKKFYDNRIKFKKKKINLYLGLNNIQKILKKKIYYTVNSISGIDGLNPTLDIIPFSKNILIANKESIICGWNLISKKLKIYKTKFIPIDSEHFSIWKLLKGENIHTVDKVFLTASGGPFLKKNINNLSNIKPKFALKHPNWKMGKKISIDSSTMMNKIFEFIEAKKIFDLKKKELGIIIHPSSFIHAIIYLKGGLIKFLAHETDMKIPIASALDIKLKNSRSLNLDIDKINKSKFYFVTDKKFPLLSILKIIPEKTSYFETILITINDNLVNKYLKGIINYKSIYSNLLLLMKKPYFRKYYALKPKDIYDIKKMIKITNKYLEKNFKYYA